jgi:hypothetical protein
VSAGGSVAADVLGGDVVWVEGVAAVVAGDDLAEVPWSVVVDGLSAFAAWVAELGDGCA